MPSLRSHKMFSCSALQAVWKEKKKKNCGINIFSSTKHSTGFEFDVKMQMEGRLKVYDVRERVDKHENGSKPCYFSICLYRRESYLYLGEIGLTPWARLWSQVRVASPWALEKSWLCLYPNISHFWVDVFRMIFLGKMNKIRMQRPGRKAKSHREQGS